MMPQELEEEPEEAEHEGSHETNFHCIMKIMFACTVSVYINYHTKTGAYPVCPMKLVTSAATTGEPILRGVRPLSLVR